MTTPLTPAGACPDDTAYYKAVLHELVDMATDLARMAHRQAKRHAERETEAAAAVLPPLPAANDRYPDPIPTLTIAFDRIARTIRRTIALARHLDEPPKNPTTRDATPARIAARKRILRRVEDIIHTRAKPGQVAPLRAELRERLDSPDLEDDIDTRPIGDIIEDILHDLQLAYPAESWKRRTPADIEALRTQAAAIPRTWTRREIENPPNVRPKNPPPKRMFHIRA